MKTAQQPDFISSFNKRRFFALTLAFLMLFQMLPFSALAEDRVYSEGFTFSDQMGEEAVSPAYTHTANFYSFDGSVLIDSITNIPDGTRLSTIAPTAPARERFTFTRWIPAETYLTANEASTFNFTAQYTSDTVYYLNIRYLYEADNSQAAPPYTGIYTYGDSYTAHSPEIIGYHLKNTAQSTITGKAGTSLSGSTALDYNVYYTVDTGTPYRVEHYFQNLSGPDYTIDASLTKNLYATSGAQVLVNSVSRAGFIPRTLTQGVTVAPDGSTVVKMYYDREVHLVTYDTGGGTYIPPFMARYGTTIPAVANPVRAGYTFAGWDKTLPATLTQSWQLIAKWTPGKADYTVIYWQENIYDDGFGFVESVKRNGTSGTLATYEAKTYTGFTLDTQKSNNPPSGHPGGWQFCGQCLLYPWALQRDLPGRERQPPHQNLL